MSYFTCTGEYIGNYCTNHKYVSSHKNNESDKCRQECENNTSCNGYFIKKSETDECPLFYGNEKRYITQEEEILMPQRIL